MNAPSGAVTTGIEKAIKITNYSAAYAIGREFRSDGYIVSSHINFSSELRGALLDTKEAGMKNFIRSLKRGTAALKLNYSRVSSLNTSETRLILAGGEVIRQISHYTKLGMDRVHYSRNFCEALLGKNRDEHVDEHVDEEAEIRAIERSPRINKWGVSDLDMFIIGDHMYVEEKKKHLQRILETITYATLRRSEYALTIMSTELLGAAANDPAFAYQFILTKAETISDVLNSFDLDCCCFAFDGEDLWALPRGLKALYNHCNIYRADRGSYKCETRILKYIMRGFDLLIPSEIGVEDSKLSIPEFAPGKSVYGLAYILQKTKGLFWIDNKWIRSLGNENFTPDTRCISNPYYEGRIDMPFGIDSIISRVILNLVEGSKKTAGRLIIGEVIDRSLRPEIVKSSILDSEISTKYTMDDRQRIMDGKQGEIALIKAIAKIDAEIKLLEKCRMSAIGNLAIGKEVSKAISKYNTIKLLLPKSEWITMDLGPVNFDTTAEQLKELSRSYMSDEQKTNWFSFRLESEKNETS